MCDREKERRVLEMEERDREEARDLQFTVSHGGEPKSSVPHTLHFPSLLKHTHTHTLNPST